MLNFVKMNSNDAVNLADLMTMPQISPWIKRAFSLIVYPTASDVDLQPDPVFAGVPEVKIQGYGKEEERHTLSSRPAQQSGAEGFGSPGRRCRQIGSDIVDLSEGWRQRAENGVEPSETRIRAKI